MTDTVTELEGSEKGEVVEKALIKIAYGRELNEVLSDEEISCLEEISRKRSHEYWEEVILPEEESLAEFRRYY